MSALTESGSGAGARNETGSGPRPPASGTPRRGLTGRIGQMAFLRLLRMYLISRRIPTAVGVLIGLAGVLQLSLAEGWIHGITPAAQQLPLGLETAAGAIVATATANPFGESERTAVRWLPWLRPTVALALTAAAAGLFAAGAISRSVPGGELAAARNIVGIAGIGLLFAPFVGGNLAWVGPLAYFPLAEYALTVTWYTPWTWPARPPHDLGAALCAGLVFLAGAIAIALRGARDRVAE
ncbi:MAG TPA: hypothetical protein VGM10_00455 [Actinocrinis sp.]|jgi:hypothetical protein